MSGILEIQGSAGYKNTDDYTYVFEHFDDISQYIEAYRLSREALELSVTSKGGDPTLGVYMAAKGLPPEEYDKLSSIEKTLVGQSRFLNKAKEKPVEVFNSTEVFKQFKQLYDECSLDFDFAGAFTKQKIEITDRQNGVFDFSLASQGLYRPVEYFSEDLKKEFPDEFEYLDLPSGLVPPDLIDNFAVLSGEKVFYYTKRQDGKEAQFICEQRQLGSTDVLINNPKAKLVKAKNGLLYAEPSSAKNGEYRVEFKTRNKRSYLTYFKEGGGKAKYVDLYIPINFICHDALADLAYIMPSLILAEQLEKAGTKTKISLFRSNYDNSKCYSLNVGIKDYGKPLDLAKIALYATGKNKEWAFASDGLNAWFQTKKLDSMGYVGQDWVGAGRKTYEEPRFLQSAIKRFFNYISLERKGDSYSKAEEMKLSIWASTISCVGIHFLSKAPKSWTERDKEERRRTFDKIKENTYLALDRISFAMRNGYTTAEMIGERMKREYRYDSIRNSDGVYIFTKTNTRKYNNTYIRDYIRQTMIQSFEYPQGSNYSTPIKEQDIINEQYVQCLEEAAPYLQKLN